MARAEDGFFDDLARGLADGSLTRGKALRLMGAALVGGTLGSVGIGEASADPIGCKRNGKNCTRGTQCCSGNCSGGTCQAQTTTSTSTSTTSTSTTPGCLPNGSQCTEGALCCGATICANNKCCTPTAVLPKQNPCTADSECCSGICDSGGHCVDCRETGGSCAAGEPCCSEQPCTPGGTCCGSADATCRDNNDCCQGLTCQADPFISGRFRCFF